MEEGLAHGASDERLVSKANGAVAAALELHGANLVKKPGSWKNHDFAGKVKKRRHKKKWKKNSEQQPLAIGSEGVATQQPGTDTGLPVISSMAGGVVDSRRGGKVVSGGERYRRACGIGDDQLVS